METWKQGGRRTFLNRETNENTFRLFPIFLGSGVGLVIVFPVWERHQLVQVLRQPRSFLRQVHKAVFDGARDRMHAHGLVQLCLALLDAVHTFLNGI
jgi:hypothetical protein